MKWILHSQIRKQTSAVATAVDADSWFAEFPSQRYMNGNPITEEFCGSR